jgi:hypothetical protein
MATLLNDTDERAKHDSAIRSLAHELQAPPGKVRLVYEEELERIRVGARVTDFLVVLVRRSARECLVCEGKAKKDKCATRTRCPLSVQEESTSGDSSASAPY